MERCVVGVRRSIDPEPSPGKNTPTVWFLLMARVLSEDSHALLRLPLDRRPKSQGELSETTERQMPNLPHLLLMEKGYGLVQFKRNVRKIEPIAHATNFKILTV